jgi:hypothetical protein
VPKWTEFHSKQYITNNLHGTILVLPTYHHGSANDVVSTSKRNQFVTNVNFSNSIAVSFNVAQITNMPYCIIWASMVFLVKVKMGSSTYTSYKLNISVNYLLYMWHYSQTVI